jgi:hemerythrin-like domain-containing protein
MGNSRRHDSLIPLSREHHYGLMVCLRIHRGLPKNKENAEWLRERARKAIEFFQSDLTAHFKIEEEAVFPIMDEFAESRDTVHALIEQHRNIEDLVLQLRHGNELTLPALLLQFADLLEKHIRMEERVLFPSYENLVSPDIAGQVGDKIVKAIGTAAKPNRSELLE